MIYRILVGCTILSILLSIRISAQQADENNLFRLAQTYEQAGQYETALRYYKDLFDRRPSNPVYFDGVRRMYSQLKRYPELIELLNERLKLAPNDVQLYAYLGSALSRMERSDEALEAWEAAIRVNPANTATYRIVAEQAITNRLYDTAVEYLLRGRESGKNDLLFVTDIARVYALQLRFPEAMDEYIRLLLDNPAAINEVERQILQFADLPDGMNAALKVVREACEGHDDVIQLRYLYAWIAMEMKDYATALRVYREIDGMRRAEGEELLQFARRVFGEKVFTVAMQAYKDVMDRYPDGRNEPEAMLYYVRSIEEINREQDSLAIPAVLRPRATMFSSSEAVPSYAGAVTLYEDVVRKYPNHPVGLEAMYRIGYLKFHRFADTEGALEVLDRCADLRRQITGNQDANILIGDIYVARGMLDEAQAQYERVLLLTPLPEDQKRGVEYKMAELYYFRGKFDDALKRLEPLGDRSSTDIANDAMLLVMFIQDNRNITDVPLAEYAKASLLERRRKYSEAAAILDGLIQRFPSSPIIERSYVTLASMLRKSGQTEQGKEKLTEFLGRFPDSILRDRATFDLADLYQAEFHDNTRALELYQNILKEYPNSLFSTEVRKRILALRQSSL